MRAPLPQIALVAALALAGEALAKGTSEITPPAASGASVSSGILIAKGSKSGKTRERRLSTDREVRTGGNAATKIDFDAVDIAGERKTPLGSMVSQSRADTDHNFVKIRMDWRAEMVQSAASLDSGTAVK
jgi:hypothetical protein